MTIEEIIRAWKAEKQEPGQPLPENPVGNELSDEELKEAVGGKENITYHPPLCNPAMSVKMPGVCKY